MPLAAERRDPSPRRSYRLRRPSILGIGGSDLSRRATGLRPLVRSRWMRCQPALGAAAPSTAAPVQPRCSLQNTRKALQNQAVDTGSIPGASTNANCSNRRPGRPGPAAVRAVPVHRSRCVPIRSAALVVMRCRRDRGACYGVQRSSGSCSAMRAKSASVASSRSSYRMQSQARIASMVPTWTPRRRARLRSFAASK